MSLQVPMTRRTLGVALAWLAAALVPALAQDAAPTVTHRPRICLVLSGGGARGLSHVGVLRALEDLHVPVDCVAGASMGAIVGGLYAAGYSPEELERIGTTLDWTGMLRDSVDRRRLPYRAKMDDLTYLSRFEFGLSGSGLRTPAGLVAGHRIANALHVLALRAGGVDRFDALPLRFRAVATNAANGESVVIDRGDLGTAMHASMAIPGLFAPVERDGALLVDGGIVNNIPVDAARSMNPDVIIAVDAGEPLADRVRPDQIGSILSSSLGALSRREAERALARADIVLRPRVAEFGSFSYDAVVTLIERGKESVAAQADALKRLSVDDDTWARHVQWQRRSSPPMRIASVDVDPGPGASEDVFARAVRTRAGDVLQPDVLAADLDRVWELGAFESVGYTLTRAAGDAWDLHIRARGDSLGPNIMRVGIAVTSDLEGASSFNALTALTMRRVNRLGAEVKLAVQGGESSLGSVELYQPLSRSGPVFLAVGASAGPTKVQVPVDGETVQYRFMEQWTTLDLGLALGRFGELRAGLFQERLDGRSTDSHWRDAPHYDATLAGFHGRVILDQLDRVNFPQRGFLAIADVYDSSERLGSDEDYRRVDVQLAGAATRGRNTVIAMFRGSSALGGVLPVRERLHLGGLFNLSGLPPGELGGSYGGVVSLLYMYRLGRVTHFADGIYVGGTIEAGNAWEHASDVDLRALRHSYALVFGVDTPLGPVYAAHGWTTGGKDSFYLYLGRSF